MADDNELVIRASVEGAAEVIRDLEAISTAAARAEGKSQAPELTPFLKDLRGQLRTSAKGMGLQGDQLKEFMGGVDEELAAEVGRGRLPKTMADYGRILKEKEEYAVAAEKRQAAAWKKQAAETAREEKKKAAAAAAAERMQQRQMRGYSRTIQAGTRMTYTLDSLTGTFGEVTAKTRQTVNSVNGLANAMQSMGSGGGKYSGALMAGGTMVALAAAIGAAIALAVEKISAMNTAAQERRNSQTHADAIRRDLNAAKKRGDSPEAIRAMERQLAEAEAIDKLGQYQGARSPAEAAAKLYASEDERKRESINELRTAAETARKSAADIRTLIPQLGQRAANQAAKSDELARRLNARADEMEKEGSKSINSALEIIGGGERVRRPMTLGEISGARKNDINVSVAGVEGYFSAGVAQIVAQALMQAQVAMAVGR